MPGMQAIGGGTGPTGFATPGGGSTGAPAVGYGGSSSVPGVVPGALGVYNQLLGLNQQNYNNLLSGYQSSSSNLNSNLNSILAGYGNGSDWGFATPAAEAIQRTFAKAGGDITQQTVGGSNSIRGSLQNQQARLSAQQFGDLGVQLAQARTGTAMQGLGLQNSLNQSYLGDLAGYHFQNTAGNLLGQYSSSQQQLPGGGGGGRGGGGGGTSGSDGMLGFGGLGATGLSWMGGGNPGVSSVGGYSGGGYYSPYSYGGGGGFGGAGMAPGGSMLGPTGQPGFANEYQWTGANDPANFNSAPGIEAWDNADFGLGDWAF